MEYTVYTQGNKDGLPIGPEKRLADPFMRMIQLSWQDWIERMLLIILYWDVYSNLMGPY